MENRRTKPAFDARATLTAKIGGSGGITNGRGSKGNSRTTGVVWTKNCPREELRKSGVSYEEGEKYMVRKENDV
ncbi:MAG: hypothetical protein AB7G75_26520 [Candidatus Binatia bacterium]